MAGDDRTLPQAEDFLGADENPAVEQLGHGLPR